MSNLISVLVGLGGVAYLCFLIAMYQPARLFCETWGVVIPTEEERNRCLWRISALDVSQSEFTSVQNSRVDRLKKCHQVKQIFLCQYQL